MRTAADTFRINPSDPRAPPQEVWDQMSEEQRERVIASLPSEFPLLESAPPEGDPHFDAKAGTRDTLRGYFDRIGRKVYLACELPVYYPDEPMFAPDVIAIVDVERHQRMGWVVSKEGKGIDFALEVYVAGDRRKDLERNVEHFARLGIHEYFIFDRGRLRLTGYRLAEGTRTYRRLMPQGGFFTSEVLGLELALRDEKLRFFHGMSAVPESAELIWQLREMVDQVEARRSDEARIREEIEAKLADEIARREHETRLREEETRRREEETRLREEATRRSEEETRLREEAERKLAEALAEIERLKRDR